MDVLTFYQAVAAVLVGNAFSALIFYVVWRSARLERHGLGAKDLPFGLIVACLVPFGIVALTALTLA